ncbi:phospholipase D-like domain-containing protein [Nannocystis pusilla]|uniref:phospholipase D-like domain-containing protein n=1 Tax=Nannocystis pusilla TaxID=889268 RepID=UPI003DA407DB
MIDPISRTHLHDLRAEPLPACWLRRRPTQPDTLEVPAPGLWRTGPACRFRQALLDGIAAAREVVLVASFLLADRGLADALIAAAARGVRIYVLTASEQRVARLLDEDDSFEARMSDEHKRLLADLAGKVLLRSADHFHAKFLVIDPNTAPQAWLSTANFNRALIDSVELGVWLEGQAAKDLAAWFAWAFWQESERELVARDRLAVVERAPAIPPVPGSDLVCATTRSQTGLRDAVLDLVRRARKEIWVSSYGLDVAHSVVAALLDAATRKVQVHVLTRPRPAVGAAVAALAGAGARVYAHDKLHAKAIVSDAGAMIMTANLEPHGLDRSFEVGVRLSASRAAGLLQTLRQWAAEFPWEYAAACLRGQHLGELCLADKGLRDGLRQVVAEEVIQSGNVAASDALDLTRAHEPKFTVPAPGARFPQQVRFAWRVVPPRLPGKATELRRRLEREEAGKDGKPRKVVEEHPHEPPAYEQGGQRYVLLRTLTEREQARRLAELLKAKVVLR